MEVDPPGTEQPCRYPGCTRPSRPDPATGRPSLYCEQSDGAGGPVHNRVSAWRARRSQHAIAVASEQSSAAPVSMARATLEQQLADFPTRLGELRDFLDAAIGTIREAGDVEAAGAEVEDAHREALAKVAEAERRASAAERAARLAEDRAQVARRERQEADAVAEEALAETARVRDELTAELGRVREQADSAIAAVRDELAAAQARHVIELDERGAAVDRARAESEAARLAAAASVAAKTAAEDALAREIDTTTQLRSELDSVGRRADHDRVQMQTRIDAAEAARQQAHDNLAALRLELATAHAETAAAQQTAQHDHDAAEAARRELDATRAEMRIERDTLRAVHAEQLAQLQRNADQRADALNQALIALQARTSPAETQTASKTSRRRRPTEQDRAT